MQQSGHHEHRELSAERDSAGGGGRGPFAGHSVSQAALAVPSNVVGVDSDDRDGEDEDI